MLPIHTAGPTSTTSQAPSTDAPTAEPLAPVEGAWWREVLDRSVWQTRLVVICFAALSGLAVVTLTWLGEHALAAFHKHSHSLPWATLLWCPLVAATLVWVTRRWFPTAAGSGIPQTLAALHPQTPAHWVGLFVSMRLAVAKTLLTASGLLGGLSLGREGPSVQIAAGVMHSARHWLPQKSSVSSHGLLTAGGAAGIAAAFNTPLGGIMFAIEELSRRPEQRNNGLIMGAIILAGLIGISVFGNGHYFGVIRVAEVDQSLLLPGLLVALLCGVAGGLFSKLLLVCLGGQSPDRWSRWRREHPVWFAAGCGLAVALIGLVTQGQAHGSGYLHTRQLLDGQDHDPAQLYTLLKFAATWLTAWSGVPGGIFAPSLAVGASLGADIASLTSQPHTTALIAMGMVGYLAAATQNPMTAFIIVMEMVDGHSMVLSLMAVAAIANGVSRLISPPLYSGLAHLQLQLLPQAERPRP